MSDLAISMLPGARLTLETVGAETSLAVNVTELQLAIEVSPAEQLVIVSEPAKVDLIEVLLPGGGAPAPAPVVYERRVDMVDEDVIYRGEAAPGAQEDAPVWRIRLITLDSADMPVLLYAGGGPDFAYAWTDRTTYTYE